MEYRFFFEKMKFIYDSHLNVVNKNAQGVVPIPPMLDLYDWIDTGEEHLVKMTKCVSEGRIMFHPKANSSATAMSLSVPFSDSANRNEWGFLHNVDEKSLHSINGKNAERQGDLLVATPLNELSAAPSGTSSEFSDAFLTSRSSDCKAPYVVSCEEAMPAGYKGGIGKISKCHRSKFDTLRTFLE